MAEIKLVLVAIFMERRITAALKGLSSVFNCTPPRTGSIVSVPEQIAQMEGCRIGGSAG